MLACATIILAVFLAASVPTPGPALRVGTSGDYAPFSFRAPTGELTGFDIVVAQRLAHDLGRSIDLVPFRWPDLVNQLRSGAFDVAMSGVTVRADRALFVDFTRPYAVSGAVAVIRAADREKFRTVTDLDRETVRIAVNRGGHLEQVARQQFAHAQLVPLAENTALPNALARGDVDAAISEEFEVRTWTAAPFTTLGPFTHDCKAYAVRRESVGLRRQIDDWLAAREADGWLDEQRRRWLGERAARTPEQAGFEALVAAMDLRLQLMPLVAAVKRRELLPIEDPAQEARVLERARSAATAAGLQPGAVVDLFRIQMDAAKAVERAATTAAVPPDVTLADVRAAVSAASDQVIAELARGAAWLGDPHLREQLSATLRTGLTTPGAEPFVAPLLDALQRVRRELVPVPQPARGHARPPTTCGVPAHGFAGQAALSDAVSPRRSPRVSDAAHESTCGNVQGGVMVRQPLAAALLSVALFGDLAGRGMGVPPSGRGRLWSGVLGGHVAHLERECVYRTTAAPGRGQPRPARQGVARSRCSRWPTAQEEEANDCSGDRTIRGESRGCSHPRWRAGFGLRCSRRWGALRHDLVAGH